MKQKSQYEFPLKERPLENLLIPGEGQEKQRLNGGHLVCQKARIIVKDDWDQDRGTDLKEMSLARDGTIWKPKRMMTTMNRIHHSS